MAETMRRMSVFDRVEAVLRGQQPDRPPFIGRLELWHRGLSYADKVPAAYREMSLTEIHRAVGFWPPDVCLSHATAVEECRTAHHL
ncbi:MAG: hypothetical protein HC802_00920 [Caldilineaceae bacterium]|nr:hypothetical protein [Caldilineaceae bacterium]